MELRQPFDRELDSPPKGFPPLTSQVSLISGLSGLSGLSGVAGGSSIPNGAIVDKNGIPIVDKNGLYIVIG